MRLGELLVGDGLVLLGHVQRALELQHRQHHRQRLGSILVEAGLVTADAVARALARIHQVPAALVKHFEARDHSLAHPVEPELARQRVVLPLARTRDGRVVVCMRDPGDLRMIAVLERAFRAPVVPSVACEHLLVEHVDRAYPNAPDAVDVDLDSGPHEHEREHELDHDFELDDADVMPVDAPTISDRERLRAPVPSVPPIISDGFDAVTIRLASLDDAGVSRDPAQSDPKLPRVTMPPVSREVVAEAPTVRAERSIEPAAVDSPTVRGEALLAGLPELVRTAPPSAPETARKKPSTTGMDTAWTLDDVATPAPDVPSILARIDTARTRDDVAAHVLAYAKHAFGAAIMLSVRDGMALGETGCGDAALTPVAIQAIAFPLSQPSVLKTVVDTRRPYAGNAPVGSALQDRLFKVLGKPPGIVIAPVNVGPRVAALWIVTCSSVDECAAASGPVLALAEASGKAYARLIRDAKRT